MDFPEQKFLKLTKYSLSFMTHAFNVTSKGFVWPKITNLLMFNSGRLIVLIFRLCSMIYFELIFVGGKKFGLRISFL